MPKSSIENPDPEFAEHRQDFGLEMGFRDKGVFVTSIMKRSGYPVASRPVRTDA